MRLIQFMIFLFLNILPVSAMSIDYDIAFRELIQMKFSDAMHTPGMLMVNGKKLHGGTTIKQIYALNDYNPLWEPKAVDELRQEIEQIESDGLIKADYLPAEIDLFNLKLQLGTLDTKGRVDRELLLTESLLRLAYHLRFGKVDPVSLDPNWNYSKPLDIKDPALTMYQAIKNQQIKALLDTERPSHNYYRKLQQVLSDYLVIAQNGGWQPIADGNTLKLGASSSRIPQIRQRLSITGDYSQSFGARISTYTYDKGLQRAVLAFQKRHGLDADGVIGKRTISAMNVPISERIDQIRINLERLRWIMQEITENYLLVDIAGFEAYLIKDGVKVWRENVVVGKAYTATPVFKGHLKYLEFNPTWTIPPIIIKNKVLPKLKKDAAYLAKEGYVLLDFKGNQVDPFTVDWNRIKGFPFMVRQPAGKNNALGLVKFIFPNPHFVFLHDTNHRELFNRTVRTFSSGCIRVDNPFKLAELLLQDNPGWKDETRMRKLIDTGKTERVFTRRQIPVLITYITASVNDEGKPIFKPDIYGRDVAILKGLLGPITIAPDVRKKVEEFGANYH